MLYHYVCCFRVGEITSLGEELISSYTTPMFLDDETAANLIELDTPEDLERWKQRTARGEV